MDLGAAVTAKKWWKTWWAKATPKARLDLARRAGTSVDYLRHIPAEGRRVSAEMAVKFEKAGLPRFETCETCRKCPWRVK
jgi:hypothetical protein